MLIATNSHLWLEFTGLLFDQTLALQLRTSLYMPNRTLQLRAASMAESLNESVLLNANLAPFNGAAI